MQRLSAAALALALVSAAPVQAGEVWVGAYAHDVTFLGEALGVGAAGVEDGTDIQLGVRSERIEGLDWLRRPYVYGLVSANTEGDTNFVAVGLGWRIDFGADDRWFFRPGLGLAYHDGEEELPDFTEPGLTLEEQQRRAALRSEKIEFGSQILFEPELALGYRLNDRTSIELSWVHLSHGQILSDGKNQGLDDVGVRLTRRF